MTVATIGTARCAVTARKAGGILHCETIRRPTTLVAPLNAARRPCQAGETARRCRPTGNRWTLDV